MSGVGRIRAELEHPAQDIASAFLRAIADGDVAGVFARLSQRTRGLLEGLYAARTGTPLHEARDRVAEVTEPLRASALAALGGADRALRFGVSGARVIDRRTAYVLLLPDVEAGGLLREEDWHPLHLLALVHESREWLVDIERTAALSADAELVDVLGGVG